MAAQGFSVSRETSVLPSDCRPGFILYLKKKERILYDDFVESGLQTDGLAHPALVIQKEISKPSHVMICILTTFGGTAVNDKYPYNESIWDNYLPIYPKPPVVSGGLQLLLGDLKLRKPSYVGTKAQYIVHTDMLECYDRKYAPSRFYLDPESFDFVLERLRLCLERTPPKDGLDEINIYTSNIYDRENARLETNLANRGEGGPSLSTGWEEWEKWDGGVTVAGMISDRSTTVRSPPRAYPRPELYDRQRQQPTMPHFDRKEPEDLQPSLTETIALVTGGLVIGAWLGYKAFRAIGN